MSRLEELRLNLEAVERRVALACEAAGRDRDSVTVIAVTKTWPASDVRLLAQLGVSVVGESRDQEAMPKHEACADLNLEWHFIGQFQTNKANHIAQYADVVHSLDRLKAIEALEAAAYKAGRIITGLVQVGLDNSEGRGGAAPAEVMELAERILHSKSLRLGGVMAVAPLGEEPEAAFRRLRAVADALQSRFPYASIVSAGMSEDLEAAVLCGATHLRIGSAIMGSRSYVQ
jgi:pyridoxal phosphate enzyme (YggS family)